MANKSLNVAKNAKDDEFYTQYHDIEKELNAYLEFNADTFRNKTVLLPCDDPEWSNFTKYFAYNFEKLGLKKLISTSYANDSKPSVGYVQTTLFEQESDEYDPSKTDSYGKVFTLTKQSKPITDITKIKWKYLEGDGDFRSEEVKKLRDSADIIVTNPPFSLFREFVEWIMEADKKFLILGNKNCVTYKEIFPLIKENRMWVGVRSMNSDFWLRRPDGAKFEKTVDGKPMQHIMACWFTNLDHGRRHEILPLMTMADNLKFNKKLKDKFIKDFGKDEYPHYDNYDAIEIPFVEAIPSDYTGIMGVPITFLDKYNPEQFEIIGSFNANNETNKDYYYVDSKMTKTISKNKEIMWNGPVINKNPLYKRIVIRAKHLEREGN